MIMKYNKVKNNIQKHKLNTIRCAHLIFLVQEMMKSKKNIEKSIIILFRSQKSTNRMYFGYLFEQKY